MQTLKTRISTLALIAGLAVSALAGVKVGDTFPELAGFKLEGALPDLKGKVVIVAVNVDENASDKEAFLKENTAEFSVVRDAKQKLVDQVEIGTMPSSFVLDRDGKVRFAHKGFFGGESKKKYVEEIDSLLGK